MEESRINCRDRQKESKNLQGPSCLFQSGVSQNQSVVAEKKHQQR